MKKALVLLSAMSLVVGFSVSASALLLTDTTLFTSTGTNSSEDLVSYGGGDVNLLGDNNIAGILDHVTWNHNFTFDPAFETIISGTLALTFRDDNDIWLETAFGYTESGNWDVGEIDSGTYGYNVGISSLADGEFQVTVRSIFGDFYLDKSVLSINYDPVVAPPAPVPEPSTILLMGMGLAGLVGCKRKKSNKKA